MHSDTVQPGKPSPSPGPEEVERPSPAERSMAAPHTSRPRAVRRASPQGGLAFTRQTLRIFNKHGEVTGGCSLVKG